MREQAPEQGDEKVVVARRRGDGHVATAGVVALRRPARAVARPLDVHVEVAAGGQLVEVVAGDVGMELEALRDLGGRNARLARADEEVDVAPGGIAECRGHRRHRGGELLGGEAGLGHAPILPMAIVEIRRTNPGHSPEGR